MGEDDIVTSIDEYGRYVIDDYHERPPFASFLPGIAGPFGIPLWVLYTNRGQAIASLGIESKNSSIVEFQPANKAYQMVCATGFRTFMKLRAADGSIIYYEPFARFKPDAVPKSQMRCGFNDLIICDCNEELGFETQVTYFVVPSEDVAMLVRKVVVRNDSPATLHGEMLDGLPAIIPFGIPNWLQKEMSNTMAAWMRAENLDERIAFYRVQASVEDQPEVEEVERGHFYLCFTETDGEARLLKPIVDPAIIFGSDTSFAYPYRFINGNLEELLRRPQIATGKQPCGFFGTQFSLAQGQELTLYSLVGHASSVELINRRAARFVRSEYVEAKHAEAQALATEITKPAVARTAFREFDLYCAQCFLDNVLRGGYPLVFEAEEGVHVYHIYARRHGDLERDYNSFWLAPECYAQGNGAYRDINQNRRCDVIFQPSVADETVLAFVSLVQLDGYNPLELRPSTFTLVSSKERSAVLSLVGNDGKVAELLERPFTLGKVLHSIDSRGIRLECDREEFVKTLLRYATQHTQATHQEGYWVDHWSYNLDLIDSYLSIYPDREEEFFFDRREYTYYDSAAVVAPRDKKYIEVGGKLRQANAVVEDTEKVVMIAGRDELPNLMRTEHGRGEIYRTSLYTKLFGLCVVKFATLDPSGMGVEMEAGKPGWCDALNGLPAIFGSSLSETYELRRLIELLASIEQYPNRRFSLPVELWALVEGIVELLDSYAESGDDHAYWDGVSNLREAYRASTKLGVDGKEVALGAADVLPVLEAFRNKVRRGLDRALTTNKGLPPTYFVHEPRKWSRTSEPMGDLKCGQHSLIHANVDAFQPRPLPLFLEGMVKAVKLAESRTAARALHSQVKGSALFDAKLGMYRLNASLANEPLHIGRTRAYTPGWLENESIFLHMHYKYLLALLSAGLVDEFWQEAKQGLVPFFDPEVYGRGVLENCSFIVSSAHPDATLHGRGFVARLSGATVEFMSIWSRVTAGEKPFRMSEDGLVIEFCPALPGWLFAQDGTLTFTFLGNVEVVYHNKARVDVFPNGNVAVETMILSMCSGESVKVDGCRIKEPWASKVRAGGIGRIDVFLSGTSIEHERRDSNFMEVR